MSEYELRQLLTEAHKRITMIEARLEKLEPKSKPKPKPTTPTLEKTRPSPQERAREREILQVQARKIEAKQREERLLEREKLGLHGIPPAKNPTSPRRSLQPKSRTLAQRKADAAVGKYQLSDFVTSDDRAIAKQKS